MRIKPIKSELDYDGALKRIEKIWGAKPGTPTGDEFEILFTLIEAYEEEHYPIPPPHPIEAIKFRLEQMELKESDLNRILGSRSRKHDILKGKRKLSLAMIRKLHHELNIPAETLIAEY